MTGRVKGGIVIGLVLCVGAGVYFSRRGTEAARVGAQQTQRFSEDIERLRGIGLIETVDVSNNRVLVAGKIWGALPAEKQERVGALFGNYFGGKRGEGFFWADIHDAGSGRRLARWERGAGLTAPEDGYRGGSR